MATRKFAILILLLCFCLCVITSQALAANTADAKAPIDIQKDCAVTIRYAYGDTAFADQTVKLYKIAEVSVDYQYALDNAFGASGLILNGIQSNSEWDVIRTTLEAYILGNNVQPVLTTTTNGNGNAEFIGLKPGLYFASAVQIADTCVFDSALVALPGLGADGFWQYQVDIAAKPGVLPSVTELKVLKLWKGDEGTVDRPKSIEVEIFRNGDHYETIILSEENHWSYRWAVAADGASWKVVEKNIPKGYTMTVAEQENTFVITNTHKDQPSDPPPQTGDTSNILPYVVAMFLSGSMMILLGIIGKRNSDEEN